MAGSDRSQFTFYESFYRAIGRIKKKADKADAYDALCAYALYGVVPDLEKLPDSVAVVFEMCKPNLDASRRKAESGKRGGAAKQAEANRKQTASKPKQTEATPKQVKEQDKEQDKEQMLGETPPPEKANGKQTDEAAELARLPASLQPVIREWLEYKRQRREKYEPIGLTALISEVLNNAGKYGDAAVAQIVRTSMASGYKGIVFDRLQNGKTPVAVTGGAPTDWAKAAVARMMQEGGT